jgi:glycosyltransferase involved in cell wall biosynthesis
MVNDPSPSADPDFAHYEDKKMVVLIPCYNEELTIKKVISDFHREVPTAAIYVYDNNSSDSSADIARGEGAVVVREKRQGKGFVIASMFEDIDADIYILVDGDDTYPSEKVHELISPIVKEEADMVVGTRLGAFDEKAFRPFHVFGNLLTVRLVNLLFKSDLKDIMSGYRVFNGDFVKKVPIVSKGFEVETQMTLQALYYDFIISEVPVAYGKRPEGSYSKLNTFRDGMRVILTIFDILKAYRPLLFFFVIGAVFFMAGLLIGSVPVIEFIKTGKITHFPSAVLASGIMIISVISIAIGIILDAINHRLKEIIRLGLWRRK